MTESETMWIVGLVVSAGLTVLLFHTLGEMRHAGPDTRAYSRWYRVGLLLMIGAAVTRASCYGWALQLSLPGDAKVTAEQVGAWRFAMNASWWFAAAAGACWCRALIYRSWRIVYARERGLAPLDSGEHPLPKQDEERPKPRRRSPTMHREENHKRERH